MIHNKHIHIHACLCVWLIIIITLCLYFNFSKEESMRMKEIIRASSVPATMSPIQIDPDGRSEHYTIPKSFPASRYPQTPPPNYQSPRSSMLGKPPTQRRSTKLSYERDSHIYHINTPPMTTPTYPQDMDPVYEQLPDVVEGNYQTPRRFFPPNVPPPRPISRRRTASQDTLDRDLPKQEHQSKEDIDAIDQEGCADYVEMNSVDFSKNV